MFTSFISYRRRRPVWAQMIELELVHKFGEGCVFRDMESIASGEKWRQAIEQSLRQSDIVFAVIDDFWLREEDGHWRLNSPEDWVRFEIELALTLQLPIVPVLINKARLPGPADLPDTMRGLLDYQGIPLREEAIKPDLKKLSDEVAARRDGKVWATRELERMGDLWQKGNWQHIQKRLEEISGQWSAEQVGRDVPRPIADRLAIMQQLMRASAEFAQRRFAAASLILTPLAALPAGRAPANTAASLALAELGQQVQSALETGDVASLHQLADAFTRARRHAMGLGLEFVPGQDEVTRLLGDANAEAAYRTALAAYNAGDPHRARTLLAPIKDYRDSARLIEACDRWGDFFRHASTRQWDGARAVLADLARGGESPAIQDWRRWCNAMRRFTDALDEIGHRRLLVDPLVPWSGGECPYGVLALPATATDQDVEKLSFDLLARGGGMQPRERNAWDALRLHERRLLADFNIYQIAHSERALQLAAELVAVKPGTTPDAGDGDGARFQVRAVAQRLGPDGGLLLRLMKNYDAAIAEFEVRCEEAPHEAGRLHNLGLAAAARIAAVPDDDGDLTAVWHKLITGFGAVLGDDRFWQQWWAERQQVYPVSRAEITQARHAIQRFWLDEARQASDRGQGYEHLLQAEISGARAAAAGGGIPCKRGGLVIVGRLGAGALDLNADIAQWVATFPADCLDQDGWHKRVCIAFSKLGVVQALADAGRPQDVLNALAGLRSSFAGDFERANPGFAHWPNREQRLQRCVLHFQEQAHHSLAIAMLTEAEPHVTEALDQWRAGLAAAEQLGRRDELMSEIQKVVIARAAQLDADQNADRLERLNSAHDLLETIHFAGLAPPAADDPLALALADTLLERAVYLANELNNHGEARNAARRAFTLIPGYPRALTSLHAATVLFARDKQYAGRPDLAKVLLDEADDLYRHGQQIIPGDADLDEWRDIAAKLRQASEHGLPLERLAKTLSTGETSTHASANAYAEALIQEARQDYAGAVAIYKSVLARNPNDAQIRMRLVMCYRTWVVHLTQAGAPQSEIDEVVGMALAACPDSDVLRDLEEFAGKEVT